eukprot:TRINITY_DN6247_c0_g1_i1.p1 TRINITY_DN6247_c0_g1~~TRINITY_DN6247_c0_g1_i1.p1  ORF type:complete len:797 (+),score=240.53 TRINITY_DN6247_c0_g1_i1:45-2435(+)
MMDQDLTKLGSGPRRKRTSMGLKRSRAHLERLSRTSSDSEDSSVAAESVSWLYFGFLFCFDIFMIGFNTVIWAFASVFLFLFSKVHDALLFKLVGNNYLYNVSWEDPRVDRETLNLTERDHVLTIASACDNVLSFIIDGAKVTAVDLNAAQLALCSLKRAAILELSHEEFFAIFAKQDIALLRQRMHLLRKHMDASALEFWDRKLPSFGGFMYSGSSGWLAYFLFRVVFPVLGFGWIRRDLEAGISQDDFRRKIKSYESRFEWIAWVADSVLVPLCAPLAGVPEAQLNLGNDRDGNVHTIIERVFLNTNLVDDNYFFLGYILGYYTERCCPRYLKADHFSKLKRAMQSNKLILYHGTLADRLRQDAQASPPVTYTAAIMLDHLDWMNDQGVNEELSLLWPLLDDDNGRVLWRSFASEPHRAALKHLRADKVDDGRRDRTGMYWGVWVAEKKSCGNAPENTSEGLFWTPQEPMGLVDKLVTGIKIVSFPILSKVMSLAGSAAKAMPGVSQEDLTNNSHAKKIEAFYASQAEAYDAFRENFLHARPNLATCVPLPPGKLTWIDVGAGTARNLEFFPIETLKRRFAKIYILDISASLLEMARRRVEAAGLTDVVELVLADFTDLSEKGKRALPRAGSVDLVTFSYSLSMIPNKQAALRQAGNLLSPGGSIGIADFFYHNQADSYEGKPMRKFLSHAYDFGCKMWFRQDGVHLLSDEVFDVLDADVELTCSERFRGSVPLLPLLRPYHGIWIARKPAEDDMTTEPFNGSFDDTLNVNGRSKSRSRSQSPRPRSRSRSPRK